MTLGKSVTSWRRIQNCLNSLGSSARDAQVGECLAPPWCAHPSRRERIRFSLFPGRVPVWPGRPHEPTKPVADVAEKLLVNRGPWWACGAILKNKVLLEYQPHYTTQRVTLGVRKMDRTDPLATSTQTVVFGFSHWS